MSPQAEETTQLEFQNGWKYELGPLEEVAGNPL